MTLGCHFLRGETDRQQFNKIHDFFGNIPDGEYYSTLPKYNWIKHDNTKRSSLLPYYLQQHIDETGIDLLSNMFVYSPEKRYTATECLEHEFFITSPLPATSLNLTNMNEIHGFEAMKREEEKNFRWKPKKRKASEFDDGTFFRSGRERFYPSKKYNYREFISKRDKEEVKKPLKVPKSNVLPFFLNIDINPELAMVDLDNSTEDFMDPNRLSRLGYVHIPSPLESPNIENNPFF